jgi:hypothetical protein
VVVLARYDARIRLKPHALMTFKAPRRLLELSFVIALPR